MLLSRLARHQDAIFLFLWFPINVAGLALMAGFRLRIPANDMIKITKGLNLPIAGMPSQQISSKAVKRVALLGEEYVGMRPPWRFAKVTGYKKDRSLFEDKKNPGVCFTAPAAGVIGAIHRGERRVLQSIVIDVDGDEAVFFPLCARRSGWITRETVQQQLLMSGQWTAFRTRPFSKTPAPGSVPAAIFVTAIDTNPLAADPQPIILARREAFDAGSPCSPA
jgi:Na+-transporting NADH:ubiquinone oxidoreductase subunit A